MRRHCGALPAGAARGVAAIAALAMLSGCAMFDSNVDFKSARRAKPLEVPPELTAPAADDRFAVPGPAASTTYSEYERSRSAGGRPASAEQPVLPAVSSPARLERAGSQRWLVVKGTPEQVWKQLKDFWASLAIPLEVEQPAIGVMETAWVEERARFSVGTIRDALARALGTLYSTPERHKYRTRLEAGAAPGTVEVYVSHRRMFEVYVNAERTETRWHPQPADPGQEAEMLRRFVVFSGVDDKAARDMLAAQPAASEQRSRLVERDGNVELAIGERFDRAWRRVGLALDRIGFTVEDRNRAEGVYFVRYVDSDAAALRESEESFFSKLAFWRKKRDAQMQTRFRIVVSGKAEQSRITVMPREPGDREDRQTARKILTLLDEQLK